MHESVSMQSWILSSYQEISYLEHLVFCEHACKSVESSYQVGCCGTVKVGPERRAKLCINILETGTIVGRPTDKT